MFGPGTLDEKMRRRSIYFFVKRSQLVPMMTLFDAPDSLQDIALRPTTTVAPQALLMMNSPIVRGYAEGFAERVTGQRRQRRGRGQRPPGLCHCAWPRARRPTKRPMPWRFWPSRPRPIEAEKRETPAKLALADFCQTLLSLNEFVFVD